MNQKSSEEPCFYRVLSRETHAESGVRERVESLPTTAGPWSPEAQHGGPPAALLGRAIEGLGLGTVGRFTMELLGPVPVAELEVTASVARPGRTVALAQAELHDVARGRLVATAAAWTFPETEDGPGEVGPPLPHSPGDGEDRARPDSWQPGYLDAIEWRWIEGFVAEPGPGVVWMRPPTLVEGEALTPLQRLLACADSGNGISALLDISEWAFINPELTVHVVRPPEGEWICMAAETLLGPGRVGAATATAYDERGPVARTAQALLVQRH